METILLTLMGASALLLVGHIWTIVADQLSGGR